MYNGILVVYIPAWVPTLHVPTLKQIHIQADVPVVTCIHKLYPRSHRDSRLPSQQNMPGAGEPYGLVGPKLDPIPDTQDTCVRHTHIATRASSAMNEQSYTIVPRAVNIDHPIR